jgi:hypothetical protein
MLFKPTFVITALVALAAATPVRRTNPIPAANCTTGPVQCCNSTEKASDASATKILGLLGIVLQDLNVLVGLTCSPITVIGVGNSGW